MSCKFFLTCCFACLMPQRLKSKFIKSIKYPATPPPLLMVFLLYLTQSFYRLSLMTSEYLGHISIYLPIYLILLFDLCAQLNSLKGILKVGQYQSRTMQLCDVQADCASDSQ